MAMSIKRERFIARAQVNATRVINAAMADGVTIDDGNVVDLLLDNDVVKSIDDARIVLATDEDLSRRFPRAASLR